MNRCRSAACDLASPLVFALIVAVMLAMLMSLMLGVNVLPAGAQERPEQKQLTVPQAQALSDALVRLCEDTAVLRRQLVTKRLDFLRHDARLGTGRDKLRRIQNEITALDRKLADQARSFAGLVERLSAPTGARPKPGEGIIN